MTQYVIFRARKPPHGRRLGNHMTGVIGALFKSHIRIEGFRVVTRHNISLEATGDAARFQFDDELSDSAISQRGT
jgi:hypothetical protein